VVVVDYASSKEAADRVVAEITGDGGRAIAVRANVVKQVDIGRLFAETVKAFGRIDVLVNNSHAGARSCALLSTGLSRSSGGASER
jgi:3-oxoacyl-[acyl-carrier protein] reductase